MVVKFTRPDFRESAHGTHEGSEESPLRRRLSLRVRLKLIYLGLGLALVALLAFHVANPGRRMRNAPLQEGTATVAEKRRADDGTGPARYAVVLRLTDKDGRSHETAIATDPASFELVEEGMEVLVEFQVDARGRTIRVTRILAPTGPEGNGLLTGVPGDEAGSAGE